MNDKYRKKPIVVSAFRLPKVKTTIIFEEWPEWIKKAIRQHRDVGSLRPMIHNRWKVGTLEGGLITKYGDWIIRGVKGEIYPCKDDIFRATYEEVVEPIAVKKLVKKLAVEKRYEPGVM